MSIDVTVEMKPLSIALLTVSDSRGEAEDSSGKSLENSIIEAGHRLVARHNLPDDFYPNLSVISGVIAEPEN